MALGGSLPQINLGVQGVTQGGGHHKVEVLSLGSYDAISSFNMRNVSKPIILRKLNIDPGDYKVQAMERLDKQRLSKLIAGRIISGLQPSCPNDIVLFDSNLLPLSLRRPYSLSKCYNKLFSFGDQHSTAAYLRNWTDSQRLKKQSPFSLTKTLGLNSANVEPHSLFPVGFDLKLEEIDFLEELLSRAVKNSEIPDLIRQLALETINCIPQTSLLIYTDGSRGDEGISVFRSELIAIRRGLQYACKTDVQFQDVWILNDSRASVQHLSNWTSIGDQTSLDILNLLDRISSNHRVHFQWVPSHVGIDGNEKADFLARPAAEEEVSPTGSLTLSSFEKIELHHLGRTPFSYPWYFGRNPEGSFKLMPRKYQTAFSRFVSDHIKALTFRQGQEIFPEYHLCYSELVSPAHILTCLDFKKDEILLDPLLRPVPGRPRATTPAEDRFLALLARRRRTTTVPQLVADHFQASGRRISATTVRNRFHNAGLYARRPVACVPLNGRQRRNCLCWAREHVSWTQQQWASVLFTDESRFTMESDSGRLLIWREQRTRYHQSNTVERHSYRGGGILVWAGISIGGHTDLHVFHGGTVTGLRYRDETLDPYVRPYAAAIGNDFILMDDNARPHRARIVEEYLEDHGLERMEWPARSPDLNPIEHLWDYLGREVAALNPPPRSLHELKQGLLCVWSSLPFPVSDNLINIMGNRCRQCIQVRSGHIPY
ncbi:transposable element Tcb2 transposase [Trichonephila clavipes]|nr:transposable element Tcb2 transposase [Trichonephila clavipes]